MIRNYEAMFILSSKLSENETKGVTDDLRKIIESNEGVKILEVTAEMRQFAYPINKEIKGTYLMFKFEAPPETISNIKEAIKHREEILRSNFVKKE